MRQLVPGEFRRAAVTLRRAPGFVISVVVSLALGVGSGLALLPLLRLPSLAPPRIGAAARAVPPPRGEWWGAWSREAASPATLQREGLDDVAALLAALALLALAVALTNALILLASRIAARRREAAIRSAVGASPVRLRLSAAAEGALLGGVASALTLLVAASASLALRLTWPAGLEAASSGPGFLAVLALLGLGLPLAAALLLSLLPTAVIWRSTALHEPLAAGARASAGPHEGAARRGLARLQLAAALALLTGAGLLLRNAGPLEREGTLGYVTANVLTMRVDLPPASFPDEAARAAAWDGLLRQARALPAVEAESIASHGAWLGLGTVDEQFVLCGRCAKGGMALPGWPDRFVHHAVGPGYFALLGARLLQGRDLAPEDGRGASRDVVVVNRTFVREVMDENVTLGKSILVGGPLAGRPYTIVGIVEDMEARGIGTRREARPAAYFPALRHPPSSAVLAVRLRGGVEAAVAADLVRVAAADALTGAVLHRPRPLEAELRAFAAPLRWLAALIAALAAVALLLAGTGMAGTIRHGVAMRRREFGTRMALGARSGDVVGLVLRESVGLAARGAALGAFGAIVVARFLQLQFPGVRLFDPPLFLGLALGLAATALLAGVSPAVAATRVDPMEALGTE